MRRISVENRTQRHGKFDGPIFPQIIYIIYNAPHVSAVDGNNLLHLSDLPDFEVNKTLRNRILNYPM